MPRSSHFLKSSSDKVHLAVGALDPQHRLAPDIRLALRTLEQSYLYLDNQSAADYLAVCDAYASTRGKLFAELQSVAEQVKEPVVLVALGSGDGRAEVCLAQALAQRRLIKRMYLLDISHSLLARAYEHAALALHGVLVEAVHGNFHEFQRYKVLHGGGDLPRLYTLLGATIANLTDELRFFHDLHSCSAPGDLALIDYQLAHDPPESDPTLKAGAIPKMFFDWHAGPLRSKREYLKVSRGLVRGSPSPTLAARLPSLAPPHTSEIPLPHCFGWISAHLPTHLSLGHPTKNNFYSKDPRSNL